MDPEVSWQCAPRQPHPVPQSNPSHSQPCLSQHSPLKTCWMAGSPQLLLSFFQRSHLKPCQDFPLLSFLSAVFNISPSFPSLQTFSWSGSRFLPCRDAARAVSFGLLMCFNPCTCQSSSASYSNIQELGRYWITEAVPPLFGKKARGREERGKVITEEGGRGGERPLWQLQHPRLLYAHEAFLNKYPVFALESTHQSLNRRVLPPAALMRYKLISYTIEHSLAAWKCLRAAHSEMFVREAHPPHARLRVLTGSITSGQNTWTFPTPPSPSSPGLLLLLASKKNERKVRNHQVNK